MGGPRHRTATRGRPPLPWTELAEGSPDGLAILDSRGRFARINRAGTHLLGTAEENLLDTPAPFSIARQAGSRSAGLLDNELGERTADWTTASGLRRELAYCIRSPARTPGLITVAFRDVTDERHRQRRLAAIARSAATLASDGSVSTTLDALAREVLQTDELAAVQILTLDDTGHALRIMGSAGFRHWPDFFERLVACHDRGASLRMLEALHQREPVVIADRWRTIKSDQAWSPLHRYLGELPWDSFASVPLIIRGRSAGVLNAFFAPGQVAGRRAVEFLTSMAEQAAIAADYAGLMQRERDDARRHERQRLARELHDSIVQQVFSISMQSKSMEVLAQQDSSVPPEAVRRIADEVGALSQTVLADLRAMVHELRPSTTESTGPHDGAGSSAEDRGAGS